MAKKKTKRMAKAELAYIVGGLLIVVGFILAFLIRYPGILVLCIGAALLYYGNRHGGGDKS